MMLDESEDESDHETTQERHVRVEAARMLENYELLALVAMNRNEVGFFFFFSLSPSLYSSLYLFLSVL